MQKTIYNIYIIVILIDSIQPKVDAPARRGGRDLDILLGHSFGTSKRFIAKRNFDEIDAAGFNDLSKRNFDEIDNAGFKDYLRKRNFDEIDAAGFNDFSKRFDELINEEYGKGVDVKKNFDEIDAAGFNDLSKRDDDPKFDPIKALIYAIRRKIQDDLASYIEEYKKGNFDKDTPILMGLDGERFLENLAKYSAQKYGKYHGFGPNNLPFDEMMNKGEKSGDYAFNYPGYYSGKYEMPFYYQPYYSGKHGYPQYYSRYHSSYYNGKPTDYTPYYSSFYPTYYAPYYNEKHGDNPPPFLSNLEKHRPFSFIERILKDLENKYGKHSHGFGPDNTIPRLTYN